MTAHHDLVSLDMTTTSLIIADKFGKMHKNVLRDIEDLEVPEEFRRLNFEPTSYLDSQNRTQPLYRITQDGFILLAMGFTGRAAMEWKVRFIEAFNWMRDELRRRNDPTLPDPHEPASLLEWMALIRETRRTMGVKAARLLYAKSPWRDLLDGQPDELPGKSDPVRAFLTEACEVTGDPDDFVLARDLAAAFRRFARERGGPAWGDRMIALRIAEAAGSVRVAGLTFTRRKRADANGYAGIRLRTGPS